MSDLKIDFIGDLQRVDVRPGDVFVLTYPGCLTADIAKLLGEIARSALGDVKVLVLEQGMTLGVVRQEVAD